MMAYPMRNQAWCNFCEDIIVQEVSAEIMANGSCNYNSITPMLVAQYMLEHPNRADWRTHVPALLRYVEHKMVHGLNKTGEPSVAWGANTVSEQVLDADKMSVHTARYAATVAMWADLVAASDSTGASKATREALAKARRSWDWSSYTLGDDGVVAVTPYTTGEHDMWFNIQVGVPFYTLKMMGANPAWAPPNATHLLRSTSVVTQVALGPGTLSYTTFDPYALERLRIAASFVHAGAGLVVTAGGQTLPRLQRPDLQRPGVVGWVFDAASGVLDVAHNASDVRVMATPVPWDDGPHASSLATEDGEALSLPPRPAVLHAMSLVNNYFQMGTRVPNNDWTGGVYMIGNLAHYRASHTPSLLEYATRWGDAHAWQLAGYRGCHGALGCPDNICSGHSYAEIYELTNESHVLEGISAAIQSAMRHPCAVRTNSSQSKDSDRFIKPHLSLRTSSPDSCPGLTPKPKI